MVANPAYHFEIPGPGLAQPFQVRTGLVVIDLLVPGSVVIPAGGGWPGLGNLPAALLEHLQPTGSVCTPDTVVTLGLSEADLPVAVALVTAQALTGAGLIAARMQVAERLGLPMLAMNRRTAASVIGVARAQMTRLIRGRG